MAQARQIQIQPFEQASDPTITDDSSKGYQVSNTLVNTVSGHKFTCVDATIGAAVWQRYYDKNEVDALIAGANFTYYYSDTADPIIGGYDLMYPNNTGEIQSTVAVAIPAVDTLIATFITQPTEPTFTVLAEGIYNSHIHMAKTAGTKDVFVYYKFYTRTSGGSETLRATSENSPSLTGSNLPYDLHASVIGDISLADDDRLVIEVYGSPSGVGTNPTVTLYLEGTNTSRFEGKTIGSNDLQQQQLYNVGKAGNDNNSGRSDNDSMATIGVSLTAITGQTPSSTNQFKSNILGGGVFTEDNTLPSYAHVRGLAAELKGETLLSDLSSIVINRACDTVGTPNAIFRKTAGSSHADVEVLNTLTILGVPGLECTSGILNAKLGRVQIALSPLIDTSNSGDINVDVTGDILSSASSITNHTGTGRINMRFNTAEVPATDAFSLSVGAGYNTIIGNHLKSGFRAFNLPTVGKVLSAIVSEVQEVTASVSTQLNLITACYRRTGDNYDTDAKISNALGGVLIEASRTGGKVHLKTADGAAVICEDYLTTGTNAANTPHKTAKIDGTMPAASGTPTTSTYALPDSITSARVVGVDIWVSGVDGNYLDTDSPVANSAFSYYCNASNQLAIVIGVAQTNISSRSFKARIRYIP